MRTKSVLRHYCDFCNKGGFKKMDMFRHESICIRNPDRKCGLCEDYRLETKPIPVLIAAIETSIAALSEACEGCPACMLAAIVQSRDPQASKSENWVDFDYKTQLNEFHQEARSRRDSLQPRTAILTQ